MRRAREGVDPRVARRGWVIEDGCLLDLLRNSLCEEQQSAPTYRLRIPLSRLRRFLAWGEMVIASEAQRDALAEQVRVLTEAVRTIRADTLEEAAKVVESAPRYVQVWGSYFDTAEGHSFPEMRATTFTDAAKYIRALSGSPS